MYSIFNNDRRQLCVFDNDLIYDSTYALTRTEIGHVDMDGNVYRDDALIGRIDSDGYMYIRGNRVGRCVNGVITDGCWYHSSYSSKEGDMGYYEGNDNFGAAAAALVVFDKLKENQIGSSEKSNTEDRKINASDEIKEKKIYQGESFGDDNVFEKLILMLYVNAWIDLNFRNARHPVWKEIVLWIIFAVENLCIIFMCRGNFDTFTKIPIPFLFFSFTVVTLSMFNYIQNGITDKVIGIIKTMFCGAANVIVRCVGVTLEFYCIYQIYLLFKTI